MSRINKTRNESWHKTCKCKCRLDGSLYVIIMSHMNFRVNPDSIVCLNVKELLAQSRHHIWSLSDSNKIRTHNHLVHKRTLNHLAKAAEWLSCVVSTYLYGAFDCMLLSCHVRVSEWILNVCLNGCRFESGCCHLNFRYSACFEQGVPLHSSKL